MVDRGILTGEILDRGSLMSALEPPPPIPTNAEPGEFQRQAAHPGHSVWVSASAGSGKTKALTDRVLHLLLDGAAPERILCLTFTRAAAAEMANRIGGRLSEWAVMEDSVLRASIEELTGAEPSEKRMATARQLFARVLDASGDLKIQTIHSFCQALLKRFPLEAGLSPDAQVMDDRASTEVARIAQTAILTQRNPDSEVAVALDFLATTIDEHQFNDLMGTLIAERTKFARALVGGNPEYCIDAIFRKLGVKRSAKPGDAIAAACRESALPRDALGRAAEILAGGTEKTDQPRGATIAAWLAHKTRKARIDGFAGYTRAFLKKNGEPYEAPATRKLLEANPDLERILANEATRLVEVPKRGHEIEMALHSAALVQVAGAMLTAYDAVKQSMMRLDYDDLISRTYSLLHDRDMAPWVLFRLDGGIDHILIDESQDTNPEQWDIAVALCEEFFAGEGARSDVNRTFFAVGDFKQSIFSFQGADPQAGEEVRKGLVTRARDAGRRWSNVSLDTSFRSTTAVLRAVDRVFGDSEATPGVTPTNESVIHRVHRKGAGGRVEVWPLIKPPLDGDAEGWVPPVRLQSRETPDARLADILVDRIKSWIGTEKLEARGRAMRPGDLMVLVRRRTAFMADFVSKLKKVGIPVAGVDRMVLAEQLAIRDLIALLRFLQLPQDDLNLAVLLKGPLIGFDEDRLFELAWDRGGDSLWARLAGGASADKTQEDAVAWLRKLLGRVDYEAPYELLARILHEPAPCGSGNGRQAMLRRLGVQAEDPIDEFLAQALAYERVETPSLEGFLHWIEAQETEIKRDLKQGASDEVRVLTVHGAKGLEAPVVILPDTTTRRTVEPKILWSRNTPFWVPRKSMVPPVFHNQIEAATTQQIWEYNRLLYVAMTRAEDRLYICGATSSQVADQESWYNLVRHRLEGVAEKQEFAGFNPDGDAAENEGLVLINPQEVEPENEADAETAPAADPPPDWLEALAKTESPTTRPLAPSQLEGEEGPARSPLDGKRSEERFKRGNLLHRLFEILPDIDPARRADACRAFLARPAHDLSEDEREALAAETMQVLEYPEFSALFGPNGRAEVSVVGKVEGREGSRMVSGQVDRLVVTEDEVLVIDYKSARPVPDTIENVDSRYRHQMAAYRALLREIYPKHRVRCALLWTAGPKLMALPDDLLDGFGYS